MCISFFYIDEKCEEDAFRFILIFNRDEFHSRETESAHFWEDSPNILGGRDLQSKKRGTWLGVSSTGKVAALLNISDKPMISNVESRGLLVTEYLKESVKPRAFRDPNLPALVYSSTNYGQNRETVSLKDGIYGISNSPIDQPFKKVSYGQQKFENVVKEFNYVAKKELLIEKLLLILKSETKNYPDTTLYEMKKNSMDVIKIPKLSSIFVEIPELNYGTRTHTILMVTKNNVGYFNEFNRIMSKNEEPRWTHNRFEINFGP